MRASLLIAAAALAVAGAAHAETTLERVKAAGRLSCGVVAETEDWSKADLHGPLTELDTAICTAIGVAALGSAGHMDVTAYGGESDAEQALHKGEVDVAVGVTPGVPQMIQHGIEYGPAIFYDALTFMVRPGSDIASIADLKGRNICVGFVTDNQRILRARLAARGIDYLEMPYDEQGEMDDGFSVGRCEAEFADASRLAASRSTFTDAGGYRLLPDVLRIHTDAIAVRDDDVAWAALVRATMTALVQAEELGVTKANAAAKEQDDDDPVRQHVLGYDWSSGDALGLPKDWSRQVLQTVGNYGEVYERTVGSGSKMKLPRGLNALWSHGGLMHADPMK